MIERAPWLVLAALLLVACKDGGSKRVRRNRDAGVGTVTPDRTGGTGRASAGEEKEPNNLDAEATPLPVGHYLRATLDGETDVDVFKVTVAGPGQLRAALTGIEGVDLVLELRDAKGNVLARSDRGPAMITEGVPGYGVSAGDYFLAVKEFVKAKKKEKKKSGKGKGTGTGTGADAAPEGRIGPSNPYELSVELLDAPPELHEIEPDDDPGTAVEVLLADSVKGWIGWSGDVDLWKLSLEGVAAQYCLDIEVGGVDGLALSIDVLDAGGERLLTRKGSKGGPVAIKSVVPALAGGAPPWHFLKISADRSHPEMTYELRFTARLLEEDEEQEPNDDAERATPLVAGGQMRATYAGGDVDRFVIEAQSEAQLLDVAAEAPPGIDVELVVGVAGQPPLATASAGGAGVKESLTGVALPAGSPIVVTVSAKTNKKVDPGGEARPYRLTWSMVPAAGDPMPPEE
jgi:hypothetical protein